MRAIFFFDKHSLPEKVSLSAIYMNQGVRGGFLQAAGQKSPQQRLTHYQLSHQTHVDHMYSFFHTS